MLPMLPMLTFCIYVSRYPRLPNHRHPPGWNGDLGIGSRADAVFGKPQVRQGFDRQPVQCHIGLRRAILAFGGPYWPPSGHIGLRRAVIAIGKKRTGGTASLACRTPLPPHGCCFFCFSAACWIRPEDRAGNPCRTAGIPLYGLDSRGEQKVFRRAIHCLILLAGFRESSPHIRVQSYFN